MNFEWNPQKAEINNKKHGVSFEELTAVFREREFYEHAR
ncbi:BrnT family toxin [Thiospirillum jenense]|uniref:BrnT family toxin n=1 Tax=Thiospirillum jenense TaxID=1653858 RepID=A0A839HCD6_9GAMM|nr:BrnT family toxin [Thiospirillum jenense]MBB1126331.1 BrnT family toxin [Thiospirillum jenense]